MMKRHVEVLTTLYGRYLLVIHTRINGVLMESVMASPQTVAAERSAAATRWASMQDTVTMGPIPELPEHVRASKARIMVSLPELARIS